MQNLKEQIRHCETLPTLPAAALRVLQLTSKDEAEPVEIAKLIEQDAALSVRVLRAVNSPFYGMSNKVSNVPQAVALLGVQSVKTLVLSFTLVNTLQPQRAGEFDHIAYWRRSMYSATAARVIAGQVCSTSVDECFLAGLLMDIGVLLLNQLLEASYGFVHDRADTHQDLMLLESHELGLTHAEAGQILAEHWRLPAKLSVPIGAHHGPQDVQDDELKKIAQVVWLGGRCAEVFLNPKSAGESISSLRRSFRELYKLDDIQCDAMLAKIGVKTAELSNLFDIRANTSTTYEQILTGASQRLVELSIAERSAGEQQKEHRRNKRMRRDGKVIITPAARGVLGKPVQVRLRDLSATGIGMTSIDRLEPGTQFVIQIPQADKSIKTLLYTVKRCDTIGGLSSIGAALTSVLSPETEQRAITSSGSTADAA
jgi:HD-like signal output (HDOD) protein